MVDSNIKMFFKATSLTLGVSFCNPTFAVDLTSTTPSNTGDRYDIRMNELSNREFKDRQEIGAAVQYDHEVITTNEDLKDTVTGATMYNRDGNAIKRVESTTDTSKIHLKGPEGTTIVGVKDGKVSFNSTEAINGSQLNSTNTRVQNNSDRLSGVEETQKAHSQALIKESEEREKGYKTNGDRITALAEEKASQKDVDQSNAAVNNRIDITNSNLDKVQAYTDTKADRQELNNAVETQSKVNSDVKATQTNHGVRLTDLEGRQNTTNQAITEVNNNAIARDQQVLTEANAYVDRTRDELNSKINSVAHKAYSGVAASMAMTGLSPVIHADKSAISASVGSYAGQGAVAVGYSKRFADDATTLRINGAVADRHFGGALGVTHEF